MWTLSPCCSSSCFIFAFFSSFPHVLLFFFCCRGDLMSLKWNLPYFLWQERYIICTDGCVDYLRFYTIQTHERNNITHHHAHDIWWNKSNFCHTNRYIYMLFLSVSSATLPLFSLRILLFSCVIRTFSSLSSLPQWLAGCEKINSFYAI